jgi:tripartite-type tricarboxylate transporter receptor subunit TctC
MTLHRRQVLAGIAAGFALPALSRAQNRQPIRVLVGFPPGGATDAIARVVVERLPALLGHPVIIDNRPGAGGRIAADALLAAPADGLSYMIAPNATPTFQMLVFRDQVKWNIERDFVAVSTIATYPLGMAVSLATGAGTPREFVEWARRNPKDATFGTPGLGGQNHFLGVQLAKTAGIDLRVVPYKGTPPMITDLVGGQLASAVGLLDGMLPHHRSGRIRIIGVFTGERSPLLREVPTFAEQGIPVTSGEGWTGMWARAGTPAAEVERMQAAVQRALQMPEVRDAMINRLWVQPTYRGTAETAAVERQELEHWDPVIRASGFKPES